MRSMIALKHHHYVLVLTSWVRCISSDLANAGISEIFVVIDDKATAFIG